MSQIKKAIYSVLFVIFLMLFAGSLKHISVYASLATQIMKFPFLWTSCGVIVLCLLIYAGFTKINNMKKTTSAEKILWLLLCIGECAFLLSFSCYPTSDSAEVVSAAIEIANGNTRYMETATYFEKYGNNNVLSFTTSWIYSIFQYFIKNVNYTLLNHIANIIFINGALYFACKIIKTLKDEKAACKLLLLAVCNPVQYMAIFWYYSATISSFSPCYYFT